jgi:hypothetical protein
MVILLLVGTGTPKIAVWGLKINLQAHYFQRIYLGRGRGIGLGKRELAWENIFRFFGFPASLVVTHFDVIARSAPRIAIRQAHGLIILP